MRFARVALLIAGVIASFAGSAVASPALTTFPSSLPALGTITAGSDGNMWLTSENDTASTSAIVRMTPIGQTTVFPTYPGSAIIGLAPGPDGNMWFTSFGGTAADPPGIGVLTPAGLVTDFSNGLSPGANDLLNSIVAGPDGNLWFSAGSGESIAPQRPEIGRITPTGQITEFRSGLSTKAIPEQIVAGPDGDLWFVDAGEPGEVGRVTPAGQITEFDVGGPSGVGIDVGGVAAGSDGNVWLTDFFPDPSVASITPAGKVTRFTAGLLPGRTSEPGDMTRGSDGNVYFVDNDGWGRAIGRVTPRGQITEFPVNPFGDTSDFIESIASGPGGIWMVDGAVRRLSLGGAAGARPLQAHLSCTHHGSARADWVCASSLVPRAATASGPLRVTARQVGVIAAGTGRLAAGRLTATLSLRNRLDDDFDLLLTLASHHSKRVISARLTFQKRPEKTAPAPKTHRSAPTA
jgi:virginiamycin B lyase